MFGNFLDENTVVNARIGPRLAVTQTSAIGYRSPTKTFLDTLSDEIAGVKFELVHAPRETDDQLFVWLPERKLSHVALHR